MIKDKEIFTLTFEAKFDDVIDNDEYKLLYHVTDILYKDKILKQGLCPKSKSKIGYHPERIYLTIDIKDAYLFSYMNNSGIENPIIFQVDLNKSPIKVALFYDPNFKDFRNFGCYTENNISPTCLKIIE